MEAFEGDAIAGINLWSEDVCSAKKEIFQLLESLDENEDVLEFTKELSEAFERSKHNRETERKTEKRNLQEMADLLLKLLGEKISESVGIFLHWYTGLIDEEKIDLESICETVENSADMRELLKNMRQDVLYEITLKEI